MHARRRWTASLTFALAAIGAACGTRTVADHYPSGEPKREGQVVDGLQSGTWRYWYEDGHRQAVGDWKDDRQFGTWEYWYDSGARRAVGAYEAGGNRTGPWELYHPNGHVASAGSYRADRQEGMWRYWYASGGRCAVGTFIAGVRTGLWRTYAPDGTAAADALFFRGEPVGPWVRRDGRTVAHHVPANLQEHALTVGTDTIWGLIPDWSNASVLEQVQPPEPALKVIHHADGSGAALAADHGTALLTVWYADGSVAGSGPCADGHPEGTWLVAAQNGPFHTITVTHGHTDSDVGQALLATCERLSAPAPAVALAPAPAAIPAPAPASPPPAATPSPAVAEAAPAAPAATPSTSAATTPAADGNGGAVVAASTTAPALSPAIQLPSFWTQAEEGQAGAVVAKFEHGPGTPELSPQPQLPHFWTHHEEGSAAGWIAHYDHGAPITDPYDADRSVTSTDGGLVGHPLPQVRFLGATGDVIDLGAYQKEHRPVVVVIMRGFAGQVCLYCAAQTVALCKHLDEFHAAGAEVVIIYPGPTESAPAFLAAVESLRPEPPPMPVAMDVSLSLVRGLNIEDNLAKPTSLVLDRHGIVRYAYIGRTMADRPSADDLLRSVHQIVE